MYTRLIGKRSRAEHGNGMIRPVLLIRLRTYTTEDNYTHYDYRLVVSLTASGLERVPGESVRLNEYGTFSVTENFVPGHQL